ncbi:MAG: hypothetical protein IJH84_04955 [Saccharopolyspora sp.]|uniref:hypothetical protein n=1 Tax=Saccharopolyspora TaxID=1835 RepID=UPI00190AC7BB|nr:MULTISPECIES: hypothetical protein [unclassified Saccharopolyspora]MBK0869173.1 hypothetical protein [Saccharopolyspora sp. HNM0986]MBQ6640371.1 hypothetical protein [Saccharopolyspora sp.]
MNDRDEQDGPGFEEGPNTVCFGCAGFRKLSEPRLYLIQATTDTQTGMTMGEWRTCPHCNGAGKLPGVRPPV